ncbi:MAG: hypothetical protein ABSC38_03295 [Verrucomicrobiia bacterium]|jgi:hypothetical protein
MKNFIIIVVVIALIGYIASKGGDIYNAKGVLDKVAEQQLGFVDENSQPAVKQKLVDEARQLGIDLAPSDIHITYEDTDIRSIEQKFTAKIADFINKRVTIQLSYTAHLVGIPLRQEIAHSRIRQIQARQKERPEMKEILDGNP